MRSTTILSLVLALVLPLSGGIAAPLDGDATPDPGRAIIGTHPLCEVDLDVTNNARLFTGFAPDPAWPFTITAGLWVGALVDHGSGPEPFVSTGLFDLEFFSVDDPPALARPDVEDLLVDGFHAVMRDVYTPDFLPDHTPLGIEVVQDSYVAQSLGDIGWVDVRYTVENISDEVDGRGLGWDLENVYLGILADPDVGQGDVLNFWSDDHGGFEPGPLSTQATVVPGAARGDLAYVYDEPGNGDDTDAQVGVVVRGRRAHRFAIWSGGSEDPSNDAERYARMRGNSDEEPTIDPPTTRSADQRILIAVGPIARLSPGEKTGFTVSLACGDLVPVPAAEAEQAARVSRPADLVVRSGASGVRLGGESPQEIWSVAGRRVATVPAGGAWDLRVQGVPAAAGIYFYRPVDGSAPAARIVVLR